MSVHYIRVETIADEKLGVVTSALTLNVNGHWIDSTGSSRLHEPDKWDESLGTSLAVARALREAASKLEKGARREVKRRDAKREKQEAVNEQRRLQRQANSEAVRAQLAERSKFQEIGAQKLASV